MTLSPILLVYTKVFISLVSTRQTTLFSPEPYCPSTIQIGVPSEVPLNCSRTFENSTSASVFSWTYPLASDIAFGSSDDDSSEAQPV